MAKIEFIESYIKYDGSDYEWSDNHGELIRCKNCKFFGNGECMRPIWHNNGSVEYPPRQADDYCSYAEKKDYSTADTPQTEETCERCVYVRGSQWCQGCNGTPKRWDGEKIVDTPQTETQTETQNSNLTFEKRTMRDCYNCKRYETEGECVECHYEPKQTDCPWE